MHEYETHSDGTIGEHYNSTKPDITWKDIQIKCVCGTEFYPKYRSQTMCDDCTSEDFY